MAIITRKYANIEDNKIDKVSLGIATPNDVLEWSHGEVTKPETINYKTYKDRKSTRLNSSHAQ